VSYKEIEAISQSMLKDLQTSPRLFEAKHILKTLQSESTRSQELGTVIHSAILEPKKLDKVCTTAPRSVLASNGHRRGKAYEDWRDQQVGKIILTDEEFNMALRVAHAAARHPVVATLIDKATHIENPIQWVDPIADVDCKGIPDLVTEREYIVDVKTCQSVSEIDTAVAKYSYHLQAAFYLTGCSIHYGQRFSNFVIVAVETNPPYRIHTRLLDDAAIIIGHQKIDELLAEYKRRRDENDWSEPAEKELVALSLPRWVS